MFTRVRRECIVNTTTDFKFQRANRKSIINYYLWTQLRMMSFSVKLISSAFFNKVYLLKSMNTSRYIPRSCRPCARTNFPVVPNPHFGYLLQMGIASLAVRNLVSLRDWLSSSRYYLLRHDHQPAWFVPVFAIDATSRDPRKQVMKGKPF